MTRIEEGDLVFEFGEKWQVFKLDEHRDYRERIAKIDETKAVDFVGIFNNEILYFIEVTDVTHPNSCQFYLNAPERG